MQLDFYHFNTAGLLRTSHRFFEWLEYTRIQTQTGKPKDGIYVINGIADTSNCGNSACATSCPGLDESQNAEKVQLKRNQWRAASARYYERHPEVKEQKKLKMVAARAAKKQARCRWDPPQQVRRAPAPAPDSSYGQNNQLNLGLILGA
ncbi:hypothetical protein DFH08DRAFT_795732 [Mycena albidolilacea]|uniref:Uncharacterized protein n=1 Tax=Mycena albidolilacea TaxID=1033008 RepID=A0AAD7AT44_9AGAR|nr:hypothetical protein DFH08DRAFT_795732 [Mycena albidolilacea]